MSDLSLLLHIHVVAALIAIVAGGIVFMLPKGTTRHRRFGYVYLAAMLTTVVAFVPATVLRFGETGWGFFHLFILVGGISALVGAFALVKWRQTRNPAWLRNHQMRFTFSYAGLLMAGFSQVATNPRFGVVGNMTSGTFWLVFAATNLSILGITIFLVRRYLCRGDPRRRYALRP